MDHRNLNTPAHVYWSTRKIEEYGPLIEKYVRDQSQKDEDTAQKETAGTLRQTREMRNHSNTKAWSLQKVMNLIIVILCGIYIRAAIGRTRTKQGPKI